MDELKVKILKKNSYISYWLLRWGEISLKISNDGGKIQSNNRKKKKEKQEYDEEIYEENL